MAIRDGLCFQEELLFQFYL